MEELHGRARPSHGASFLESSFHRQAIIESISAGALPLKFAYAGSAAYTHDHYASGVDYTAMMASAANESDILLSLGLGAATVGGIAELGPGNGLHTVTFLRHLAARGLRFRRYLAIDFSATLLEIACDRLRSSFDDDFLVETSVWDFEDLPLSCVERWRAGEEPVLVCLLGHTLGNVEDPSRALGNLAAGLRNGDVLLASVLLRQPAALVESTMTAYRTHAFRCAALEPLIACGLRPSDLELVLRYVDSTVVGEVTLLRDARVEGLDLAGGHHFRCFLSRRFTCDEVVRLIENAGWSIRAARVDETRHHMTVAATRG
ncbi:hypothetical protein C6361_00300 [Plantactinospora sp. BC1]|uniref:L-histidine N(alpha)-methyltransferase n=1 Tax=Plantactinospora sp. BC1 TaxID=2108470 RepID=UPI000D171950|nr:L-histidine N(alpha)-methyltransferase [Plantactinospora sp. BC1]AVT28195.1 hypothetical protein C6361_00300 [Plantactinospora sp. BC1]